MQKFIPEYGSTTCTECNVVFEKASKNQVTCSPLCARRRERKRRKVKAAGQGKVFQQRDTLARATKVLNSPTVEQMLTTLRALRALDLPDGMVIILGDMPEGWEREVELELAVVQDPVTGEWRMN